MRIARPVAGLILAILVAASDGTVCTGSFGVGTAPDPPAEPWGATNHGVYWGFVRHPLGKPIAGAELGVGCLGQDGCTVRLLTDSKRITEGDGAYRLHVEVGYANPARPSRLLITATTSDLGSAQDTVDTPGSTGAPLDSTRVDLVLHRTS